MNKKSWFQLLFSFFIAFSPLSNVNAGEQQALATSSLPAKNTVLAPRPEDLKGIIVTFCSTDTATGFPMGCYTREFLEQRGSDLVFVFQDLKTMIRKEETLSANMGVRIHRDGAVFTPDSGLLVFPLEIGKEWTLKYERNGDPQIRSARVVGSRTWNFNGQDLSCLRIRSNVTIVNRAWSTVEEYTYCSAISAIVERSGFGTSTRVRDIQKK